MQAANVKSRRGAGVSTTSNTTLMQQPPASPTSEPSPSTTRVARTRSGQFGLSLGNKQDKDDHTKQKFRVHLPIKMLLILTMIFILVPLSFFAYKEMHIHQHNTQPHFKTEKFVNVNTEDVLSKMRQRNQNPFEENKLLEEEEEAVEEANVQSEESDGYSKESKEIMEPPEEEGEINPDAAEELTAEDGAIEDREMKSEKEEDIDSDDELTNNADASDEEEEGNSGEENDDDEEEEEQTGRIRRAV